MDYVDWQQGILDRKRGSQRWDSRLRVYEYVRTTPLAVSGDVGSLCRRSKTAPSTFYVLFGNDSPDRLVDGEPMSVVLAETKSWSLFPYLAGVKAATDRMRASERTQAEALLRAACEWGFDEPELAGADSACPPPILIAELENALELYRRDDADDFRVALAAIARSTLAAAAGADRDGETSIGILNTVRPALAQLLGEAGDAQLSDAAIGVVEALTDYAEQLAQSPDPTDARRLTELRPVFERFLSLLPDGSRP